MAQTLFYLFKEIRPRQWIKNGAVFAAIFFSGQLLDLTLLGSTILAFLSFCATSSAIYIVNDLADIDKDRLHPFKKNRPLASGKLSRRTGILATVILTALALFLGTLVSSSFVIIVLVYFALQVSYSFYLKNIILLDIFAIAAGFLLRVFAGEVATGYHIDIWLFYTVISGALFIAIGKRRSELTLLSGWHGAIPSKTRTTLNHYSEKMLDVYISMFANSTWLTYAFYSFLQQPPVLRKTIGDLLFDESTLYLFQERKWLMLTIPIVIYGIMRYLQLIYEKNEGESPEKVLLSDRPLVITALVLGVALFLIVYVIGK